MAKQYATQPIMAHKAGHVPQFYPSRLNEPRAEVLERFVNTLDAAKDASSPGNNNKHEL